MSANVDSLQELRERERRLAEIVLGIDAKVENINRSRRERAQALENIRTAIAKLLLRAHGPAEHARR